MPRPPHLLWLSWIALPTVVLLLARVEIAFSTPDQLVPLVPGVPWLVGAAHNSGRFWLSMILGSGNACWLAAWLSLVLLIDRCPSLRPPRATLAVAGPLAAALLSTLWACNLAVREGMDEVIGLSLILHLPVQAMSFGLVWLGLRGTRRVVLPIATLLAFGALDLAFQLRYQEPGRNEPPDVALNYASMLLALALAVCLWRYFGWSADHGVPNLSARPQEVSNP